MSWFKTAVKAVARLIKLKIKKLTDQLAAPNDGAKSRQPPPPPTRLQFPRHPTDEELGLTSHTTQEIFELFRTIHKTGPTLEHLQCLAVQSIKELGLDQLVPDGYLPDDSWNQDPATAGGSNVFPSPLPSTVMMSNGVPVPGHETYFKSAKELLYSNEDAFGALERKAMPNQPPIRLAMFRKFWENLFQVASYWDPSLDNYENDPQELQQHAMDIDSSVDTKAADHDNNQKPKQTYTGRRLGTGRDMPPRFRDDTIFTFVEAVAMAFRCRVEHPRIEPKVKLQNLLIPVPQTGAVYRGPKDRDLARRGIVEGPLLGIQSSAQVVFRRPEDLEDTSQGEIAHVLKEVGLMLSIAQKRARDGQQEPDPSEGKWWATKPRWGGGSGGEIGTQEEKEEEDPNGSSKGRKRPKKSSPIDNWRKLQPPPRTWDKGVLYLQVGRDKRVEHDDVFFPP